MSAPQTPPKTGETIHLHILRYNPADPASVPRMQTYELEQTEGMTLFIALTEIREKQDPSLQFDFVCRAGICGSCGMVINGRPGLACRTLTKNVGPEITLAPLPAFELIGDLSVNTGKWMRAMSERLEAWLHMKRAEVEALKQSMAGASRFAVQQALMPYADLLPKRFRFVKELPISERGKVISQELVQLFS